MLHIVMFEQTYYNLAYLLSYWVVARPHEILLVLSIGGGYFIYY